MVLTFCEAQLSVPPPPPRKAASSSFSLLATAAALAVLRSFCLDFVLTCRCRKCPACLTILLLSSHRVGVVGSWACGAWVNSCLTFGCLVFCAWHALLPLSRAPWVGQWPPGLQALSPCELLGHSVLPLPRAGLLPSWAGLPPPLLICLFRWSRSSVASWEVCREVGFWNLTDLELSLFCTPFIFLLYF